MSYPLHVSQVSAAVARKPPKLPIIVEMRCEVMTLSWDKQFSAVMLGSPGLKFFARSLLHTMVGWLLWAGWGSNSSGTIRPPRLRGEQRRQCYMEVVVYSLWGHAADIMRGDEKWKRLRASPMVGVKAGLYGK